MRVRFADLRSVTRSIALRAPISATDMLAETIEEFVWGVVSSFFRTFGLAERLPAGAQAVMISGL